MKIRVAIKVTDEKDRKHLSTTLRLANLRDEAFRWEECPAEQADVVIIRRGEPDSQLLNSPRAAGRPVCVVYSMNPNERHPWVLRWPARTSDLSSLAESLVLLLQAQAGKAGENRSAAGSPAHSANRT